MCRKHVFHGAGLAELHALPSRPAMTLGGGEEDTSDTK